MDTRTRRGILALAVALLSALCSTSPMTHGADATPADNSAINARDRSRSTLTPIDQSEAAADLELAARLRRKLLALPNLSLAGQNIKIITREGRVTLRGPVPDKAERSRIELVLAEAAGKASIDSQLEIAASR